MRVEHQSRAPVIVIGHGSSGTSIFCNSVRKYLQISFGTETQFILRYHRRLHRYGNLGDDANLRRLISDITRERYFQRTTEVLGWRVDPAALIRDIGERSYRGLLEAIFWQLSRHNRMERWGDKGLHYEADLPVIDALFPNAQYIHVVRDGRDVALSVMSRYWGPKNIFTAAHEWRRTVSLVDAFCHSLSKDRWIVVRYEDFLAQPITEFARLISFLGVHDPGGTLIEHISANIGGDLKGDNADKWRVRWCQEQRIAFEKIAAGQLRDFGYDTIVPAVDDACSPLVRAWWSIDNKLRKYMWRDYWRDNLYKAALRGRQIVSDARLCLTRTGAAPSDLPSSKDAVRPPRS